MINQVLRKFIKRIFLIEKLIRKRGKMELAVGGFAFRERISLR